MSDDQANDPGQQLIDTSRAPRTRGFIRAAFVEVLTDDGWRRVNLLWENGVVYWMVLMRITFGPGDKAN